MVCVGLEQKCAFLQVTGPRFAVQSCVRKGASYQTFQMEMLLQVEGSCFYLIVPQRECSPAHVLLRLLLVTLVLSTRAGVMLLTNSLLLSAPPCLVGSISSTRLRMPHHTMQSFTGANYVKAFFAHPCNISPLLFSHYLVISIVTSGRKVQGREYGGWSVSSH